MTTAPRSERTTMVVTMTLERLAAARGWEAFYEHELRSLAAAVRAGGTTDEALDQAAQNPRVVLARRAIDLLRKCTDCTDEVRAAEIRAAVRSDLERVLARSASPAS